MEQIAIPLPPDPAVLAGFPAPIIADTIERLLAELDARDGDPDVEPNGDELDGSAAEDEFISQGWDPSAGCPISDPGEYAYPEWHTRGRHKVAASGGEVAASGGYGAHEDAEEDDDAEDDDRDACLCSEDDPRRRIRDGLPGDSYDTEWNGDEGDYSDGDFGHCGRYGVDQTRPIGPDNPVQP